MSDLLDPTMTNLALAATLFVVAAVEVLPPLGRFIPGHLLVGVAGAATYYLQEPSLLPVLGAFAGALVGDVANYERARRHPRIVVSNSWWLPGGDVDRLERGLAKRTLRTLVLRRFFTRDRALVPLVAGGWGVPFGVFLAGAVLACLAWAATWLVLGFALAAATSVLPAAVSVASATAVLLVLSRPLEQRPRTA